MAVANHEIIGNARTQAVPRTAFGMAALLLVLLCLGCQQHLPRTEAHSAKTREIKVANAAELLKAIGPDRTILLAPGTYDLTATVDKQARSPYIGWKQGHPQDPHRTMVIKDVRNLSLVGDKELRPVILVKSAGIEVLGLSNVSSVHLTDLRICHDPRIGNCSSAVLYIENSRDVRLSNTALYGCGSIGIQAKDVDGIHISDSIIDDCPDQAVTLKNCTNVRFVSSTITRCGNFGVLRLHDCGEVLFENCRIASSHCTYSGLTYAIFHVSGSSVTFRGGAITQNVAGKMANDEASLKLHDVDVSNNQLHGSLSK
ncbi:MAG: right-handed parallel beta-helix repeat-containing protein [Coriobacteriia bacterium]|nr:right-handed parallel beta-helix repeat-containing protein [Coriobacteriia bacterium]